MSWCGALPVKFYGKSLINWDITWRYKMQTPSCMLISPFSTPSTPGCHRWKRDGWCFRTHTHTCKHSSQLTLQKMSACLFTFSQCGQETSAPTSSPSLVSFDFCFLPAILCVGDSWGHHHLTLGRHPRTKGHCRVISQNPCLCVHPPVPSQGLGPDQKLATQCWFSRGRLTKSSALCQPGLGHSSQSEGLQRQKWTVSQSSWS